MTQAQRSGVLVGLGPHGAVWHGICADHPGVELTGYVGRSDASRERAATEWKVPRERIYASLPEALDRARPDFVLDVTPPEAHREVALASFAAGVPVLGEKPLSDTMAAAREIVAAAEAADCIHMVAQQMRFAPLPRAMRRLLAEGAIGDPGQVDVSFHVAWADRPGSHYVTEPYMFLLDMGCHHFDMLRYVLAGEPESANVVSWNLPWGWHAGDASHVAVFDFAGGAKVVHRATGCTVGQRTEWSGAWRIDGPGGTITYQHGRLELTHEHRTDRPRHDQIEVQQASPAQPKHAVLDEWLAALDQQRAPECSGRDNLGTMAMTFAAAESASRGQSVAIGSV